MAIDYREFQPPPDLRRHVECLWWLHDPDPGRMAQTIYPDGRCELIAHLARPMQLLQLDGSWRAQATTLFAAQQRQAIRLRATGEVDCIGLRLRPAVSALVAGGVLPALRDRIVDLAHLAPGVSSLLAKAAVDFRRDGDAGRFWQRLRPSLLTHSPDAVIGSVATRVQEASGLLRVTDMAHLAGLGLRSFQSRFLHAVGLSPKEFARLLRLQAALRMLDRSDQPLSRTAAEAGFSDQAHATREFRRTTGLTPARLSEALRSGRDDEHTIALAAAFVRGHGAAPSLDRIGKNVPDPFLFRS